MTAREFFAALGPVLAPTLQEIFDRRDLCVLATRVAIETAKYFGIEAEAVPVRVIIYNAEFAKHVACGFTDVVDRNKPATWGDGSWSVGIGMGRPREEGRWDGHLIAIARDCFADFSIQQAERLDKNIVVGESLVGPYSGQQMWECGNDTGTVVEYHRTDDGYWRTAPDWRDEKRRRPIVGKLIRAMRAMEVSA